MPYELRKKLDCDEKIKAMQAQLHRTEERIRHKKRKVVILITEVARCMFKIQLVSGFNAWKLSNKLYLVSLVSPLLTGLIFFLIYSLLIIHVLYA